MNTGSRAKWVSTKEKIGTVTCKAKSVDVVCHFYKGTWHANNVNITEIERHRAPPNFGPLAPVK